MTPETCTTSNTQRTDRDETANVALIQRCWDMAYDLVDNYSGGDSKHFLAGAISAALQHVATSAAPTLPADVKGLVDRLTTRLRQSGLYTDAELADEAAAALTAQAALLDRAREVIKPFAEARVCQDGYADELRVVCQIPGSSLRDEITVAEFRAASRLHHEMAEG